MRFDRLDILRYGALTDRVLDFRPGAALHVVYGANEAGKSSALKAISDLLFGFPSAAEDSFLHEPSSLRIGAVLSGRDRNQLAFRRRRGRKNTLIDHSEAETPLADDALAPYLGSLGRDVFERAFGLNSHRLRQGALEMLHSGGEIGSLLFSAASGLTGLSKLRQSLESEAEGIFATRRSKDRLFYQALDRHDEARKAERELELRSGDWKKLLADAADAEREIKALQQARQETRHALGHLTALKRLEPLIREIDADETSLLHFVDLQAVPSSFEGQLEEALRSRTKAVDGLEGAEDEAVRLGDELRLAEVDEAVFAAADRVVAGYAEKGSYLKAREDLSRVRGEVEGFDQRLAGLARKLGLPADPDGLQQSQPADADLAHLGVLSGEGRDIRRRLDDIAKRLEEERDYLSHLDSVKAGGRLIDPKPYADQLAALQPDLAELTRLDALAVRVARARSELAEAAARLSPPVVDLDQLLATPLPDLATLADHRRRIDEATTVARQASTVLGGLLSEKETVERDIAGLQHDGTIVTRDDITTARSRRDGLFQAFAGKGSSVPEAEVARSIAEADRLADSALTDAERVARHQQLRLRLVELKEACGQADRDATAATADLEAVRADYQALFAGLYLEPDTAERMIEWRRTVEGLAKQRDALHALEDELAALQRIEQRIAPVLQALSDACGVAGYEALPVSALGRALNRHVTDIGQRWTESRAAEGKRQSSLDTIEKLEARRAELRDEAERWGRVFAEAVAAIGLPPTASVEMAEASILVWKDVPATLSERENRRRRVRGMERDIQAFEDDARGLAVEIAPELATLSADAVVDILHERVVAANADHQRRTGLIRALERAQQILARARLEAEEADAALSTLASAMPVGDDLSLLLQRLQQRRDIEARLMQSRRRFDLQAEGRSEDEVRLSLSGFDRVAADLDIERLEAEDHAHVEQFGQLTAVLAENERQRRALETGKSAEYAVFEKHAAEQEARELARQWVVLKLAAHLLGTSMEAYREAQADPMMTRAGDLFSVLTGGRFARLVQDYGTDDALHLKAERASGERVPLGGLSEGTGDQLYLALRLAFLEDYCSRNEPAPLIVDDIFQTFDDDRTASGLKALAGTSGTFQTILFTHQLSVVDIAVRELGDGVDLIRI